MLESSSVFSAEETIEALRAGTVSREHVGLYTVGRERYLSALVGDLGFVTRGGYKVRLLVGDWGYGKTHLLSLFGDAALAEGLAVSHVELHAREAPLERTEVITAAITRNARFGPGSITFEEHLTRWGATFEPTARPEIDSWLRETSPSLEFRTLLRHVLGGTGVGQRDAAADCAAWLAGSTPSPEFTKATGLKAALNARIAADVLTSFARFVQRSGSSGLLLLLDEAEAITSLTTASRRDEANQTLKRLLDNPEMRTHVELVFATTRRFVEDEKRGARSYPALWERIRESGPRDIFNPRATVLELEPLSSPELARLGDLIVQLHAKAYGWDPSLSDDQFVAIAASVYPPELPKPLRRYVRSVVAVLDVLQGDPTQDVSGLISRIGELVPHDD